jgi:hypothetical protein
MKEVGVTEAYQEDWLLQGELLDTAFNNARREGDDARLLKN